MNTPPELLQHHPACSRGADCGPDWLDERRLVNACRYVAAPRLGCTGPLFRELSERVQRGGGEFVQYREEQRNAAGEPIGPILMVRSCDADIYADMIVEVAAVIDRYAARLGATFRD